MMNTQQIMKTALKMAGFRNIPADSEIHVQGSGIRRVLVAIDVGIAELLLAKELECDAVIAHHPAGGLARLMGYKVFERHVDQMAESGVPRTVARAAIKKKTDLLELQHHSDNYDQVPAAAKRMKMPLVSIHSPCDEIGRQILIAAIKSLSRTATVNQLVSRIYKLPEFQKAETSIKIRLGSGNRKSGRVVVSHAAFTNGGYDVARAYFDHGTDTLSYIHISEADLSRLASEKHGNLIVLGHIVSDWLGINSLLRQLAKHGIESEVTTDLGPAAIHS